VPVVLAGAIIIAAVIYAASAFPLLRPAPGAFRA